MINLNIDPPDHLRFMKPFYEVDEESHALCVQPDAMEYDEIWEFSEYSKEQAMYLGIRNMVLSLWNWNPKVIFYSFFIEIFIHSIFFYSEIFNCRRLRPIFNLSWIDANSLRC